eukprot:TRINITY_DN6647_c0_g1_i1.p1 TRINITY_DN6647_c0_g1~~TRINITY_DN6647_c0_g1_i1.p1  ORF type:complete len:689 (+),score=133.15 TRINITY_DN6647_c0_g1_i1:1125-3191(+)
MMNFGVLQPQSCFLCQKDNKVCDLQRPCSECKRRNTPHMCMGIEIETRSQMAMQQQRQQREKAYAAAATAPPTPRANASPTPAATPPPSTSQTSTTIPQVTEPSTPESNAAKAAGNKKKRKRQPTDGQAPLLPAAPNESSSNMPSASNYGDPAGMQQQPAASQAAPAASVSPEDQMKINYFLLNELRKTKEEQIQMARELQIVKVENHKLHTRMVQAAEGYRLLQMAFRQMHPTYHLNPGAVKIPSSIEGVSIDGNPQPSKGAGTTPFIASSALTASNAAVTSAQDKAFSGWLSEKAMVVFDLSKNPAVVLTCNDAFCRLFGYQMENVIGMAWKKFIDQSYFERTMSILLQNNGAANRHQTSSIQFMQVYKAANGSTFVALDTHTFLYGTTGPRADLVTITPVQADHPNPSDQSFWPVTEAPSPHPDSPLPPGAVPAASASSAASNIAHAFSAGSDIGASSSYVDTQGDATQSVGMAPPPVRRRKIVETPAYNPKVQEINGSDDSLRAPSPPPAAEASYAVGPAKPRKPRQPKAPKAAAAASSTSAEAPKAKRAGPGRPKRASSANTAAAAAAAMAVADSSPSSMRIEELPSPPIGTYTPVQNHQLDLPSGSTIILPPVDSTSAALDPMMVDQTGPFGVNLPEYQEDEIFGLPGDVGPVFQPDDLGQSVENSEQYADPNALFYDVFSP